MLDVDGVLTDGKILYTEDGKEYKSFDVKDGFAMAAAVRIGLKIAVISGRESSTVTRRMKEVGVTEIHQKVRDKIEIYNKIKEEHQLSDEEIAYVGDDVLDIGVMKRAGLAFAVSDAAEDTKKFSHSVTNAKGGNGAVRETLVLILKAQDKWSKLINRFEDSHNIRQ